MTMADRAHPIPDAALARTTAIVGTTGAGKSYAARSAVENLLDARRRVCIVDPTGVWYGLRTSAAGDTPGYPVVIFGGDHADVPIGEHAGERLADVVATRGVSCVVDISELGIGARHRFMTDFLGGLYARNKAALHLILDEADELAPQNPLPETRRLLHATDRIIRRGRVRGFRPMLITQRPAVIHKNVLSQIGCLVALKLTSPQDRKAIEDWVKGHADAAEAKGVLDTLAKLKTGEGWVWWPEGEVLQRTRFPRIRTADTSRAPEDDEEVAEVRPLAPVEVDELRALVAEVEEEEPAAGVRIEYRTDPKVIERARQAGWSEGYKAAVDAASGAVAALRSNALDIVEAPAASPRKGSTPPTPTPAPNASEAPAARRAAMEERPAQRSVAKARAGDLGARQKVLDAIAWWEAVGITPIDRRRACITAGYSPKASTFGVYIADLVRDGLVETQAPSQLLLTPAGRQSVRFPATGDRPDLPQMARGLLKDAEARVLDELINIYPAWIRRGDLADRLGYSRTASTLGVYLAAAGSFGFTETKPGQVRAAPWLFGDAQ